MDSTKVTPKGNAGGTAGESSERHLIGGEKECNFTRAESRDSAAKARNEESEKVKCRLRRARKGEIIDLENAVPNLPARLGRQGKKTKKKAFEKWYKKEVGENGEKI